jgi:hypothetical protein
MAGLYYVPYFFKNPKDFPPFFNWCQENKNIVMILQDWKANVHNMTL